MQHRNQRPVRSAALSTREPGDLTPPGWARKRADVNRVWSLFLCETWETTSYSSAQGFGLRTAENNLDRYGFLRYCKCICTCNAMQCNARYSCQGKGEIRVDGAVLFAAYVCRAPNMLVRLIVTEFCGRGRNAASPFFFSIALHLHLHSAGPLYPAIFPACWTCHDAADCENIKV